MISFISWDGPLTKVFILVVMIYNTVSDRVSYIKCYNTTHSTRMYTKVVSITSYHCWPLVFKNNTHKGSDLDPISLSKRLSQEIFSSTFVTHWAAISWAVSTRRKEYTWSGAFKRKRKYYETNKFFIQIIRYNNTDVIGIRILLDVPHEISEVY